MNTGPRAMTGGGSGVAVAAPFLRVELPGQPIAKPRASAVRSGSIRFFKNPKTVRYEDSLAMLAKVAMKHRALLDGAIAIKITAIFEVPKSWTKEHRAAALGGYHISKPDFDNVAKIASDALKGIVWTDDCRVARAEVTKLYGAQPSLRVDVFAL